MGTTVSVVNVSMMDTLFGKLEFRIVVSLVTVFLYI